MFNSLGKHFPCLQSSPRARAILEFINFLHGRYQMSSFCRFLCALKLICPLRKHMISAMSMRTNIKSRRPGEYVEEARKINFVSDSCTLYANCIHAPAEKRRSKTHFVYGRLVNFVIERLVAANQRVAKLEVSRDKNNCKSRWIMK